MATPTQTQQKKKKKNADKTNRWKEKEERKQKRTGNFRDAMVQLFSYEEMEENAQQTWVLFGFVFSFVSLKKQGLLFCLWVFVFFGFKKTIYSIGLRFPVAERVS